MIHHYYNNYYREFKQSNYISDGLDGLKQNIKNSEFTVFLFFYQRSYKSGKI